MAVAIPLIMAATGASAAIGAAIGISATAVSIGTGLAMAVTGLSSKVDQAASKVFGKDLVNAANIVGTVYGAFGGFSGAGPGEVVGNVGDMFKGVTGGGGGALSTAAQTADNPAITNSVLADSAARSPGYGIAAANAGVAPSAMAPKNWFSNMTPQAQGALIQVGGNLLQGGMQGYGRAKQMEDEREAQAKRDAIFRSGSGYDYTKYGPRSPVFGG